MDLGIDKKVAIVTGASAGLGRAIASSLAGEGAAVAISGRNRDELERAAGEIRDATGGRVLAVAGDVTKVATVKRLVDRVVAEFNTVHILVNNVGQAVRGKFMTIGSDSWQRSIEINLMSAVHVSSHVVPHMQRQKWGRIINIAALSATEPRRELAASNVMKSGLVSFSKTLSRELAPDNILVNCVSPGLIESPQNERYFSNAERKRAISEIPLGRFGRPGEFADIVTFLCSERAGYLTGINLIVDGGASKGL